MSDRIFKLNSLLKKELGTLIMQEIDFKQGAFATVSRVSTSDDLSQAKVYIQGYPTVDTHYIMQTLEKEKMQIQKVLHKRLYLKILPRIVFVLDRTSTDVSDIDDALAS